MGFVLKLTVKPLSSTHGVRAESSLPTDSRGLSAPCWPCRGSSPPPS